MLRFGRYVCSQDCEATAVQLLLSISSNRKFVPGGMGGWTLDSSVIGKIKKFPCLSVVFCCLHPALSVFLNLRWVLRALQATKCKSKREAPAVYHVAERLPWSHCAASTVLLLQCAGSARASGVHSGSITPPRSLDCWISGGDWECRSEPRVKLCWNLCNHRKGPYPEGIAV